MGKFFFRTMASIAELERDIIKEPTEAGLKAARARGRKGARKKTITNLRPPYIQKIEHVRQV